jgi:hypothetical protein
MATTTERLIVIPEVVEDVWRITIQGTSPLIQHRFSEKLRTQLREKHEGKAPKAREFKDVEALVRAAAYVVPGMESEPDSTEGKFYVPGIAFKHAAEDATRYINDRKLSKAKVKGSFFIDEYALLSFAELIHREDVVRNATGVVDIRHRPQFNGWSAVLRLEVDPSAITIEQTLTLLNLGGWHCGVGEWRPSAPKTSGQYGRFRVSEAEAL